VADLARLTLERDWHVRFIELMPLGGGECAQLSLANFVPNPETRTRIERELGALVEVAGGNPSDELSSSGGAWGCGLHFARE
jgi:cyclic pyranopterin phosphate synthase